MSVFVYVSLYLHTIYIYSIYIITISTYYIHLSTHYYIHAGGGPARGEAVLAVLPGGAAGDQHRGGGRQAEVRLQHLRRLRDRGHEQEQGPGGDQHPQQPMILIHIKSAIILCYIFLLN